MAIEFKLPEVSEGVQSVDIAEVRVAEGDVIEAGAVICEVETDKAVAEINCPHAGRISKVMIKAGETVNIGASLVLIEATGGNGDAAVSPQAAAPSVADAKAAEPALNSAVTKDEVPVAADSSSASVSLEASSVEFKLPEVSEGVTKVDVAAVMVKVGDVISSGAVVCEVETDKAVAEINCPHAGTITAVHVAAGTSIEIGTPLVTIQTAGAVSGGGSAAPAPPVASSSASTTGAGAALPAQSRPTVAAPAASGKPATAATAVSSGRPPAPAGPASRRLARKLGVDLYQVQGSAHGGRITIEDIEAFVRDRMSRSVPSAADTPGVGIVSAAPLPDFSKFGPVDKQPMNKIFRTAAANLHAAWVTIPHVTQHDLADITEL